MRLHVSYCVLVILPDLQTAQSTESFLNPLDAQWFDSIFFFPELCCGNQASFIFLELFIVSKEKEK